MIRFAKMDPPLFHVTNATERMVKNTTGGKGHKSQRADDPKAAKNRRLVGDWIIDTSELMKKRIAGESNTFLPEGTMIGRVTKRMGNSRMEVFAQGADKKVHTLNVPLRGGMTGRAKKSLWVETDKLVLIAETGLAGASHEIFAVLEPQHVVMVREFDLDMRFFAAPTETEDAGYEFAESDVDVDDL